VIVSHWPLVYSPAINGSAHGATCIFYRPILVPTIQPTTGDRGSPSRPERRWKSTFSSQQRPPSDIRPRYDTGLRAKFRRRMSRRFGDRKHTLTYM